MTNNNLDKLKTSLGDTINKWIEDESSSDEWIELDTYISDNITELMRDAAFNVLLAQKDLTAYYTRNNMLKE